MKLVRGPAIGILLALLSQAMLRGGDLDFALPPWILFYGCAMSLLLSSAVRLLFPPVTDRLQGTNAPALWLKQAGGSDGSTKGIVLVFKAVAAIVAAVIAYQFWKRGQ